MSRVAKEEEGNLFHLNKDIFTNSPKKLILNGIFFIVNILFPDGFWDMSNLVTNYKVHFLNPKLQFVPGQKLSLPD